MIEYLMTGKVAFAQIVAPGILGLCAYITTHLPVFATILDEKTSIGVGLLVIFGSAAAVSIKAVFKFLMTLHDCNKVIQDTVQRVDRIEIKMGLKDKC
jgi:uncharacterized membrane protein